MDFKGLFSQLSLLYAKLTKQQKIIIASAIVGIVGFLIFLVVYTAQQKKDEKYKALFDTLTADEASKVVAQLEKDNVPYKIEDNNIIKVPKSFVYKERITIAAQGIPKNKGVGWELFNKQEFGATNFDQKIKHLRALEGELARTISALSPIKSCSVSLALPKETLFVEKQAEPTASVMVELEDGMMLNAKQIRGLKNLVAASVTNLKSSNVKVISSDGVTLGDDDEMSQMNELSVAQQKYKLREEKKKQEKIIDVIAPFVGGKDKVVAQVTIEFDFSQQSSTSEKYDPENVVRSEQVSEEKKEGGTPKQVGGVPGTVSNIGPVKGLKSNQISEKFSKNTATTNYEVGKTVSTTKSQFARIKRITAAVVVDGKYKHKQNKDETQSNEVEYVPLNNTELKSLLTLASSSIGIDKARGDQISVENLKFDTSSVKAPDGVSKAMKFFQKYIEPFSGLFKYTFVILLLFILYKKIIVPFADKMLEISKEEDDIEAPTLDFEGEEGDDLVEKVQQMRMKVEQQLGVGQNFNEDELKYEVILEKVKAMVEDSPEDVASLLQTLLSEEFDGSEKPEKG